jgi:hypothetical protein
LVLIPGHGSCSRGGIDTMAVIASGMAQNRDSGMAPAWDLVSLAKAGEYARVTAASLCDLAATTQVFLFAGIVLVSTRLARAT